ncbi:Uncharacterized protein DBV15_03986 [Temnothorax longispinosus]|uniref:Uncharacterized protein n=1 Tax=Temnothorax longispinosus TaxID=300112 RepID=A0A4S2LBE5_9HYME|nr:Uncharacterized protein DBV15_03986 [Temnothorax longispinosus]
MVGIRGWRGRKNGRSRGTAPRRGSHASTPITRDSLTIGFPLAVTEIYRKPVHLVLRALRRVASRRAPGSGRFAIPQRTTTEGKEIEARDPRLSNRRELRKTRAIYI